MSEWDDGAKARSDTLLRVLDAQREHWKRKGRTPEAASSLRALSLLRRAFISTLNRLEAKKLPLSRNWRERN